MFEFFFRRAPALLVLCFIAPHHAEGKLSFGIYAADKPTSVVKKFRPRLNEIQTRLNEGGGDPVRIKMQIASSYDRDVDDIIAGRVDFARLSPASQGAFDAGALKEGTYRKLQQQGAALRMLATFPNVTKPWVARAGMDEVTFQQLRDGLLSLRDEQFYQWVGQRLRHHPCGHERERQVYPGLMLP